MQRIMIVTHGFPPESTAGTERMAEVTVKELIQRGFDVALFTARSGQKTDITALPPEKVFCVPKKKKAALWQDFDGRQRRRFQQALRKFRPETVYFHHTLYLSFDLPLIAKQFGTRVVFMTHDFWLVCPRSTLLSKDGSLTTLIDRRRCANCLALHDHPAAQGNQLIRQITRPWLARLLLRRRDRVEKQLYRAIDCFISPSQTVARVISRRGVPANKMHVIPYGLPPLPSTKTTSSMIRFGFIGTLVPHKGANWLIEAFSKLDATLVTLTLWGPLEKPGELSTLRDQPNIRYAGQFSIGHTADIYSQIDCLIVPSRWPENQPLVILQAWQTGTPVITGNLGGMAELVTDGQNGLLYRWLDSTDLLNKLRLFIHDQQLRAKLRQGAQTTKVLSPQEHLDRIVPLLTELQ